jgi:hypothetical protein
MSTTPTAFQKTLCGFCDEMRLTFPELAGSIDRAAGITADTFWKSWSPTIQVLANRDHTVLLGSRGGFLVGAVRLTPALWGELSEKTQHAIWRYLRTMLLEAAMEVNMEGVETETMHALMGILTEERMEAGGSEAETVAAEAMEEVMGHLNPLMEKLKGFVGGFMDVSGLKDIPMPEIPEHLRRGRIARLAEEMAKQFNPEEFGIDPALLSGDDVGDVLKRLAELFQRDPTKLIGGAKRVADRIKTQIMGGSLDRDELLREAQEFVTLFKEHPLFKEALAKFESMTGGAGGLAALLSGGTSGGSSGGAPSERRRAVQERLRKKLAARQAAKK